MTVFAWGLVGPGRIAHKFAEAVQRTPGMHLARVQGRDAGRAEAFARRWAVDGRPAPQAGTDLAALLADPAIDAVYIATPHAQHAEAIEAALLALPAAVRGNARLVRRGRPGRGVRGAGELCLSHALRPG
jgi:predicted dehydrogenase